MIGILAFAPVIFAVDRNGSKKEENRIANSTAVMGEILNVPDNIPRELLDKASYVKRWEAVQHDRRENERFFVRVFFLVGETGGYARRYPPMSCPNALPNCT